MTNPAKATKTTKNQPQPFRESLAATAPGRTALAAPALPKVSLRALVWVIWALATVALGVGAGRLIVDLGTTAGTEPGVPVAQATIQQPTAAAEPTIVRPVATVQPNLTVKPGATSARQAQAGIPYVQQATAYYQPASDADSLQPGFQTEVRIQGNIGTQPSL